MALFDQLGKKLAQTGQSAVKKTKDMAEVAKINSMISDEEKSINNNYYQIGKLYVSMHGNDCEDDFKGMLESIRQSEKKIVEYKEQVQLIKGVVRCEKCGGEVSMRVFTGIPNSSAWISRSFMKAATRVGIAPK